MRMSGRTWSTLLLVAASTAACADGDRLSGPATAGTLVFVREVPVPGTSRRDFDIYRAAADGSGVRPLTRSLAYEDFGPAISPDGRRVAFWRIAPGAGLQGGDGAPAGLRVMNADGSGVRALGAGGVSPTWSPDGERIAFTDDGDGQSVSTGIWVTDLAGVTRTHLSAGWPMPAGQPFVHDEEPDWSPDGAWIAFSTNRGTARTRIAIGRAEGSELRFLTSPDPDSVSDSRPKWSPDGRAVAFVRWTLHEAGPATQDVWVADLLGERNVTRGRAGIPIGHDWTADGGLLVGTVDGSIVRFRADGMMGEAVVRQGRDPSVRF